MQRIQRQRTKNWKKPKCSKYVGRPTQFGNPFRVGVTYRSTAWLMMMYPEKKYADVEAGITPKTIDECLELYRLHLETQRRVWGEAAFIARLQMLAQYDYLMCWCKESDKCHVDVLIEYVKKYTGAV